MSVRPADHVPRVTMAALEHELALRIERIASAEGCSGREAAERLLARMRADRDTSPGWAAFERLAERGVRDGVEVTRG